MITRLLATSGSETGGSARLLGFDADGFRVLAIVEIEDAPWAAVVHPNGRTACLATWGETSAIVTVAIGSGLSVAGRRGSEGEVPCSLIIAGSRSVLLVAHYESGGLVAYRLDDDGTVGPILDRLVFEGGGPDVGRQEKSHPHCVTPAENGRLYVTDLGADRIHAVNLDEASGRLTKVDTSSVAVVPGTGPRHATRLGNVLIVSGELSSRILTLPLVSPVSVEPANAGVVATGVVGGLRNYPGDVIVTPHGFAYLANRGAGTISVFAVEENELTMVGEFESAGAWPMKLDYADGHLFCAVRDSGVIRAWRIDPGTGIGVVAGEESLSSATWVAVIPEAH